MGVSPQIIVTLISAPRKCAKCAQCEALIERLRRDFPGRLDYRTFTADDEEAQPFGVIMPPMLLVEDFLVSAGRVPDEAAVRKLVERELQDAGRAEEETH